MNNQYYSVLICLQFPCVNSFTYYSRTSCCGMTLLFQSSEQTEARMSTRSARRQNHLPDSLSAESSSGCCTSPCQSKAPPRACPESPGLCRSETPSPSLSWTLASCRWILSDRICSSFWRSEAARCSSPPVGCWCLRTGCSTGRKTWAAVCVGSGSSSVHWEKKERTIYYTQTTWHWQEK